MCSYVFCHEKLAEKDDNDDYMDHEYDSAILEVHRVQVIDNQFEEFGSYKIDSGCYEPPYMPQSYDSRSPERSL